MTWPDPAQRAHGDDVTICPMSDWRMRWTWPVPWHS
jgi:hypothetical protein